MTRQEIETWVRTEIEIVWAQERKTIVQFCCSLKEQLEETTAELEDMTGRLQREIKWSKAHSAQLETKLEAAKDELLQKDSLFAELQKILDPGGVGYTLPLHEVITDLLKKHCWTQACNGG